MATPTRKRKFEEVRWSLSRYSLAVRCAGVSAFRFPIVGVLSLVAISTTHCTVHMSDMSVAWRLGSVGTCNVSVSREWDGHGRSVGRSVDRSVGRSVDARGPVDHDSVGLAQARPNYISAVRTYSVNASSTLLTRTLRTPIRAGEKSKTMQVLISLQLHRLTE